MASIYPALKAEMGKWTYYIAKMTLEDLAKEVKLSYEVQDDVTLEDAVQRDFNKSRAKKDMINYLHYRDDRFFNSIVVAALGGRPTFQPVRLADGPENTMFKAMGVDQSYGALMFEGGEKYYALDGQHRLMAIRTFLDPHPTDRDDSEARSVPEELRRKIRREEISVIMIVHEQDEGESYREFLQDYRRLFSSLNRYAKPTDEATNIIMDEDDGIAILTRRLISEHDFFRWTVRSRKEYQRIKTSSGKNLNPSDPYFTQIEVFYNMNKEFLSSAWRENAGWQITEHEPPIPASKWKSEWRIRRPEESVLEKHYAELVSIWDALLALIPSLRNSPADMRVHNPVEEDKQEGRSDHLLFWPIGQESVSRTIRMMLNAYAQRINADVLTSSQVLEALSPLGRIDWDLHNPPWRHLFLVERQNRSGTLSWGMRSEDRVSAQRLAEELIMFLSGYDELDTEGIEDLKIHWQTSLLPPQTQEEQDNMWDEVLAEHKRINT